MKRYKITFLIMSQTPNVTWRDAFDRANTCGALTLIEGVELKSPRTFIASITFAGAIIDCLNLVHYFGGIGVRGVVESVTDETAGQRIAVADIDRDLITDKKA